jgi:hypothetical protein
MFGEQKCATGAQNSCNLRKNLIWLVHRAKHEGGHNAVDAGVLERKFLCRRLHDRRVETSPGGSLPELCRHMWIRLS